MKNPGKKIIASGWFLFLFMLSVQLSTAQQRVLSYVHTEESLDFFFQDNTKALLRLPLNQPFLEIAQSTPSVKERYGFFKFKDQKKRKCSDLALDTIITNQHQLQIRGRLCDCIFTVNIESLDSQAIALHLELSDSSYNRVLFHYLSDKEEAVFGLGEQYSHLNLKGQKVPVWVEEQGIGAGDQPITAIANIQNAGGTPVNTYAPIPFYISNHNYSLLLQNTCRAVFDFSNKKLNRLEVWDHELSLIIQQDTNPLNLLEAHTARTGRPVPLPNWAYGSILGLQGGSEIVELYVDRMLSAGADISAIWIQDWVGRRTTFVGDQLRWYWETDTTRYPNLPEFCQQMQAKGIQVLGYINPMMTADGPFYDEADQKGYFVKNEHDETYVIHMTGFDVGLVDLTHPEAREWIKNIIKENMISAGLRGWMADFGEALPWDAVLYSGESAETFHNRYPVEWAQVNREAIQEMGMQDSIAFFSRSSFTGGPRYSSFFWAGDQMTSWQKNDGLRSIIPALQSSGISGMVVNHADIGGFAGFWRLGGLVKMRRRRKLLQRHIELACFTPIFRTHEGILPKRNVQVYSDTTIANFYARFSKIHQQLHPYLRQVEQEACTKGYPMVRALYLHYPDDPNCLKMPYQFLLGSDLMVAPQYKKGKNKRKVYLPAGKWRHIFTKENYEGGKHYTIKTPIGFPAVFIKADSQWMSILSTIIN